jgi:SRSO17 transposase
MVEPHVFYNSEDLWQNPRAKEGDRQVAVEPYYVPSTTAGLHVLGCRHGGEAMTTMNDGSAWSAEFAALLARLGPRFGRVEPRRRVAAYLQGLLAPVERKNGWQLAEAAGDRTPDGVQEFLSRVRWDAEAVRDDLLAYVAQHLGDPGAVLVLDETGFVKKGTKSAGVQRQYSGTAGRIENCQVGVFLGYASRYGRALIDRALYLPEGWAADLARRVGAGIPDEIGFATKPKLGLAMLARAHAAGVPFAWVAGDSVYGADSALRRWLQAHGLGYVLAVTKAQRLGFSRVEELSAELPPTAWQRLSAGDGAKGPRRYDWAYLPCGSDAAPGWEKGLLIRRSLAEPGKLAFHLTHAAHGTALADLVQIAGTRWTIEACFEAAKGEVGLDQYEVRSWTGWHRHVTLAMLAHAYLAVLRKTVVGGGGHAGPGRRASAAHRPGNPPPALAPRLATRARHRGSAGLVPLATATSAMCTTLPLAATHSP